MLLQASVRLFRDETRYFLVNAKLKLPKLPIVRLHVHFHIITYIALLLTKHSPTRLLTS